MSPGHAKTQKTFATYDLMPLQSRPELTLEKLCDYLQYQYLGCMFPLDVAARLVQHLSQNTYCDMWVNPNYGRVVEQHPFIAYQGQGREELAMSNLQSPFYWNWDIGVRLADRFFEQDLSAVANVDSPSPLYGRKTVKLWISCYSLASQKFQLQLWPRDNPISLRALIKSIRTRVEKYLTDSHSVQASNTPDMTNILTIDDLVLLGFCFVSHGTIMPILQRLHRP